ncbi:DNA-binding response regulator [Anaerocolumna cellulosilytica]|uniref:Stage 0 sporulation protein A homolog n=1 Tax=Anaerocolumna cellulosilytica TaxID=433286 RepID=A0A6S6QXI5_9FIRM|nr:response regulator transcription factor [Anaerocolumna cellulosilytica]MBB5195528.1 two-component system KDP operon response regulator KdpE [Anaerocolumna cellulosilytica]BCJ93769.1 DNA-binding response regulator [Anaerocolumna cellulosilytica]
MQNNPIILIVEDDDGISSFISAILKANDYSVLKTNKGTEAVSMICSHMPDLVILDLGLPDIDGVEVLKKIRTWSGLPILIVSARGHERDKVETLDLGADDFITKPFGTNELLARIRMALRHARKNTDGSVFTTQYVNGKLKVDCDKRVVTMEEKEVHLTPIEYKIIVLLCSNVGKVLTHDYIIRNIWGPYTNESQTLRVNMANIRRKLEKNPAEPEYILTEIGVGYRMAEF